MWQILLSVQKFIRAKFCRVPYKRGLRFHKIDKVHVARVIWLYSIKALASSKTI